MCQCLGHQDKEYEYMYLNVEVLARQTFLGIMKLVKWKVAEQVRCSES